MAEDKDYQIRKDVDKLNELAWNTIDGQSKLVDKDSFIEYQEEIRDNYPDNDELNVILSEYVKDNDTGWQEMEFPNGFQHYSEGQKARYRRIDRIVHLQGAIKNTNAFTSSSDTSNPIATITDTTCRPPSAQRFIQQGSGMNRFLLTVTADGVLYCSRYGTTSNSQVSADSWLNIYCTFMADYKDEDEDESE